MPPRMKRAIVKKAAGGLTLTLPLLIVCVLLAHAIFVFLLRCTASENLTAYRVAHDSRQLCSDGAVVLKQGLASKCTQDKVWLDEWYWVIMVRQTIAHHIEESNAISGVFMALTQNVLVLGVVLFSVGYILVRGLDKGKDSLASAMHDYSDLRMAQAQALLHLATGASRVQHNAIEMQPQQYQAYHPPPQRALAPPQQQYSPFTAFSSLDAWQDVPLETNNHGFAQRP